MPVAKIKNPNGYQNILFGVGTYFDKLCTGQRIIGMQPYLLAAAMPIIKGGGLE